MPGAGVKSQRGFVMAWWGYLLILAFVGAAGWAVVHTYNSAIERATKAEADNVDLRQKNSEQLADNMWLRMDKQRVDALLARREGVRQGEANARGEINAKLDQIFRDNKEARDWGDQPVPVGLRLRPSEGLVDKNAARVPAVKPHR